MKIVRAAKRVVAATVPGIHGRLKQKRLAETIRLQQEEMTGLRQAVSRLEKRNDVWEQEVRMLRGSPPRMHILWPVLKTDLFKARFKKEIETTPQTHKKPPYIFNWVVPPMGEISGGHTTILRAIQYLESKGHTCRIYFYDALKTSNLEDIKVILQNYPNVQAEMYYNDEHMSECDAIFATSWHTAYPVANCISTAKKFYFVQDFEPMFDPVGSYSVLADNTYRLGLHGITIGSWLSDKLSSQYDMPSESFEFGVNPKEYFLTNTGERKKILFYARPVTPRRGFELGMLSLELFHKNNPEYEIHLVGWDISLFDIDFPCIDHGVLSTSELNKLYNECSAGLVLSFTNMSLFPLEMLAAGCVPVMNESNHTHAVGYADLLEYADPLPSAIAEKLAEVAKRQQNGQSSRKLAESAMAYRWSKAHKKMEEIITSHLV